MISVEPFRVTVTLILERNVSMNILVSQSVVYTICPPFGTIANITIVLAHIPYAITKVDSAPSNTLIKRAYTIKYIKET